MTDQEELPVGSLDDLQSVADMLPEPARSIYRAQLGLIAFTSISQGLESQVATLVETLRPNSVLATEERRLVAQNANLLIAYSIELCDAILQASSTNSRAELTAAIRGLMESISMDLCTVAAAGKVRLNARQVAGVVGTSALNRLADADEGVLKRLFMSYFRARDAKAARREFCWSLTRTYGLLEREQFLRGESRHLCSAFGRYEPELVQYASGHARKTGEIGLGLRGPLMIADHVARRTPTILSWMLIALVLDLSLRTSVGLIAAVLVVQHVIGDGLFGAAISRMGFAGRLGHGMAEAITRLRFRKLKQNLDFA